MWTSTATGGATSPASARLRTTATLMTTSAMRFAPETGAVASR